MSGVSTLEWVEPEITNSIHVIKTKDGEAGEAAEDGKNGESITLVLPAEPVNEEQALAQRLVQLHEIKLQQSNQMFQGFMQQLDALGFCLITEQLFRNGLPGQVNIRVAPK